MAIAIKVNGGTAGVKAAVSAGATVTATLDSIDGVGRTAWRVSSTDETILAASFTLTQSGSVGQNVSFTMSGAGTALLLEAVKNGGISDTTGLADPTGTTANVKIYVPTAAGLEVGVAGENYESDSTFGATGLLNATIRLADALSPSGIPVKVVKAATTAALPANTRSGNVLTANANGAFAAVDGQTINVGERFLAQNEGGGASHVNNGLYTLTTAGSGGSVWTATRAVDYDASSEVLQGIPIAVQAGTVYGGKFRRLVTAPTITLNTTALEYGSFGEVLDVTATRPIVSSGGDTPDLSWAPNANVNNLGYGFTNTPSVTNGAGALALTAGGGAASLAGSTTATVSANGGPLTLEGSTNVGITATTGDVTISAGDDVSITATDDMTIGASGTLSITATDLQLTGVADGTAGVVGISTTGVLSRVASGSGLNALAKVLENDTTALGTNGVPIKALPATLEFISTAISEILIARASGVAVDDVVTPIVAEAYPTGGVGDVGLGVGFMFRGRDAGGNLTDFAHIVPIVTDATSTTLDATLYFQVANNGALVNAATLDNVGLLTTLGGMTAGGAIASGASSAITAGTGGFIGVKWDTATATSGSIGPTNMTALSITPNTTITGTLTKTGTALTTSLTAGIIAENSTDATNVTTVQNGYITGISSGSIWQTTGSVAKRMRAGWYMTGTSGSAAQYDYRLAVDAGAGSFSAAALRYTNNIPGAGGTGLICDTYVSLDSGNGFRVASSGGTERGQVKWTGSVFRVNGSSSNSSTLAVGDTDRVTATTTGATITGTLTSVRNLEAPSTPSSSGAAVTLDMSVRNNQVHTTTEATTVTISGITEGQRGLLIFIQGATGYTVTMPAASSSLEYTDDIDALTVTGIVNNTAGTKTILEYYVISGPKMLVYFRNTSAT